MTSPADRQQQVERIRGVAARLAVLTPESLAGIGPALLDDLDDLLSLVDEELDVQLEKRLDARGQQSGVNDVVTRALSELFDQPTTPEEVKSAIAVVRGHIGGW